MIYQKPTRTVTDAYTTADTDNGCRIICNSASAFEVTLHTATGRYNFDLEIDNIGAGTVTVSGQTIAQYGHAHIGGDGTSWIVTVSGGSAGAVAADDVSYDSTSTGMTATDAQAAIDELFTSGSNGKATLETAIEAKGGTVDKAGAIATFTELEDGIDSIPTSGGTCQSKTVTPDAAGQTVTPDAGYDALSQVVINGDADLVAANIKSGVNIFGVSGSYTGGGAPTGDYTVRFVDYDGTVLKTGLVVSGESATPPSNPDHTDIGLTFQEWNYTSAQLSDITCDLDVGATYITTDEKTHLYITVTAISGLAPILYLKKSDTSTLTVDWGDGNTSTFTNSGNFNTGAHTYATAGDYIIKMWISSGIGAYSLGSGSSSTVIIGGKTQNYRNTLKQVFLGSGMTSVNAYAFYYCYSLQTITLTNGITSIGNFAFYTCRSLAQALLPASLTTWGTYSFGYCYSLTLASIPQGITTVSAVSFYYCFSLSEIHLHNSITRIYDSAFSYSNLQSIIIPNAVTNIGGNAFQNCLALKAVRMSSGLIALDGLAAFNGCYSLASIEIPTGLIAILSSTFQDCYSLKSMDIHSGVTAIGSNVFNGCVSISEYVFGPTTPPTLGGTSTFAKINPICKIYVPDASVDAYKAATYWSTYANYIHPISER